MSKPNKKPLLTFIPFGGLAQIGSNMIYADLGEKKILIDCGILFPYENAFNIEYLIPDMSQLEHVDELIITHGHEDHIGAIGHVLKNFPDIVVHAPEFAKKLLELKLRHMGISHRIHLYDQAKVFYFDKWEVHPIEVNHSIPGTFGLLLLNKSSSHCLFYVSDFKVDPLTTYETYFNFDKLSLLTKGIEKRYLCADSTNILNQEKTASEMSLIPSFERILSKENQRVFVTLFTSNIHRVRTIIETASKTNRSVVLLGRSVFHYIKAAQEVNLLPQNLTLKDSSDIKKDERIVVILTGCQGEYRGALRRVAHNLDPVFTPSINDIFVFSSKPIPGNSKRVSIIINKLVEAKAKVITDRDMPIHVSGHPGQEDLKILMNEFRPTHFIPIHGESYFLDEHINFVEELFPNVSTLLLHNFDSLQIFNDTNIIQSNESLEPLIYQSNQIELDRSVISERRKLSENGVIFVAISLAALNKGKDQFFIDSSGVPLALVKKLEEVKQLVSSQIRSAKNKDPEDFKEELRVMIRNLCHNLIGQKPMTFIGFV